MRAGEGAERGLEVGDGPPRPRQLALVGCKQEGCWLINIGEGECGVRGGRAQEGGEHAHLPAPPTLSWGPEWAGTGRFGYNHGSAGICVTGTPGLANRKTTTCGNKANRANGRGF